MIYGTNEISLHVKNREFYKLRKFICKNSSARDKNREIENFLKQFLLITRDRHKF